MSRIFLTYHYLNNVAHLKHTDTDNENGKTRKYFKC